MHKNFCIKYEETKFLNKDEFREIVLKSLPSSNVKDWDAVSEICQSVADWIRKKSFRLS